MVYLFSGSSSVMTSHCTSWMFTV